MAAILVALAGVILTLTFADEDIRQITVTGQDIEIEGVGLLQLDNHAAMETLLSTLHELCDYYSTCKNSINVPDHVRPFLDCCIPCDCSDGCFAKGNCCRDKIGGPRRNEYGEVVNDANESCTIINAEDDAMLEFHLMVTQCQDGYQGEARDKCRHHHGNSTSLEDLAPVYSKHTGVSYANVHCATCNNNSVSLAPWTMLVSCERYSPIRHTGNLQVFIQDGCRIQFSPPLFDSQCFMSYGPKDCDRSKYQRLCGRVRGGVAFVKELAARACYQCGLPIGKFCQPGTPMPRPFETLLNWDVHSTVLNQERGFELPGAAIDVCRDREHGQQEKACPRLTCPPSQIEVAATETHCVDAYVFATGLCLDYALRVTVPTRDFKTPDSVIEEVRALFPFDVLIPEKLEIVDFDSDTQTLTYDIRIFEELPKDMEVLQMLRDFVSLLGNAKVSPGVRIELGTTGVAFMPQPLETVGYLSYYADNLTAGEDCLKMIAVTSLQYCTMAMFASGQYRMEGDEVVLVDGNRYMPHEYVTRQSRDGEVHVQMCEHTYLTKPVESTSNFIISSTASQMTWLVGVYVLPYVMYCLA